MWLAQQVGHHGVPVLGIGDAAEHALMGGEGEAVVEGVGHPRQLDVEADGVQRLAVLVLLAQLLEVIGIDVVEAVALVTQVDAREVAFAQLLGALQQATGDVKAVEAALVGLAHVEGQLLGGIEPGLPHLDVDAVVGRVKVLELHARDDFASAAHSVHRHKGMGGGEASHRGA